MTTTTPPAMRNSRCVGRIASTRKNQGRSDKMRERRWAADALLAGHFTGASELVVVVVVVVKFNAPSFICTHASIAKRLAGGTPAPALPNGRGRPADFMHLFGCIAPETPSRLRGGAKRPAAGPGPRRAARPCRPFRAQQARTRRRS